ncbi:MAG TPA: hypothetical protein VGK54_17525, partial [Chloroflexota bacterium]
DQYRLICKPENYELVSPAGKGRFSGAAGKPGPKLYVVSHDGWPIYVGVTRRRMSERLSVGWRANGAHGYHGYEWRTRVNEVGLDIWALADESLVDPQRYLETIEAELVHLIRRSGQWPKYQTEIHFHESSDEHRDIAQSILAGYHGPAV